ncbi:MAG: IS3 family transposase [Magnetococcus sp. YQC-5]
MCQSNPIVRQTKVLALLNISRSSWYHRHVGQEDRRTPGPKRTAIQEEGTAAVRKVAEGYPMWGYKRIAVVCRREGIQVSNKQVYRIMKELGLLQQIKPRKAELYQVAKLFELLPQRPNDLWQTDVTYIHIPGHGWWYAVTVIDYFSRYLLALHLTPSYAAVEVNKAIKQAMDKAESIHGKLSKPPFLVTDNGSSFLAKRFQEFIADGFQHVRIQYRTPTQLGLLERFHQTLKIEEVYWRLYDNPGHCRQSLAAYHEVYNTIRPHWALRPEGGGDPVTPADVYAGGVSITIPKWQHWAKAAKKKLQEMMEADADKALAA